MLYRRDVSNKSYQCSKSSYIPVYTMLFGLSCVQNNNQRLFEDMILIDDDI